MTARNRRQIDRNCAAVLFCFHKKVKNKLFRCFFQVGFSVRVSLTGRGPGPGVPGPLPGARAHMDPGVIFVKKLIFENLKFEMGGSGCRGWIRIEELVWTLLGR